MQMLLQDWIRHPWLETVIWAVVACVVGFVLARVGRGVLLRLARPHAVAHAVVTRAAAPLATIAPLLALQVVWNNTGPGLHLIELVRHVNSLLLISAITWLGMRCIAAAGDAVALLHPIDMADNLAARRVQTQSRVIARVLATGVMTLGLSAVLMTFPSVREIGLSLLASAGVAGLVAGIAARPVLGNLIAGIQIALTQPIRIDDVVIVQGEWGWIEEIDSTYVVVRLWDQRRLVVPLQWFIENPFQNWTRTTAQIVGSVFIWVDYRMPLAPLREAAEQACRAATEWDGRVCLLQVTEAAERAIQLRLLVSSADSPRNWDLRCRVREALVTLMQREYPEYLPVLRVAGAGPELSRAGPGSGASGSAAAAGPGSAPGT